MKDIQSRLDKAKLLGLDIKEVNTVGGVAYIIHMSKTEHIVLISPEVTKINNKDKDFTQAIFQLRGDMKVIGGENLLDTVGMFSLCYLNNLDLSGLNTSKVETMRRMFNSSTIKKLDLSNFNTSRVKNMSYMFDSFSSDELNINGLDTSKVKTMRGMFLSCKVNKLDLINFNTSKVTDMYSMFAVSNIKKINLNKFNTSSVKTMINMFRFCKAERIDISSFTGESLTDAMDMFNGCRAEVIYRESNGNTIIAELENTKTVKMVRM